MAETELTTTARPAILYEYIWFDGRPLAQVDGAGTVSWTFTDHLGTPLLQTSSLQGIVWRAEHEPYGSVYALRSYDRHQPLRFPGQEAEQLGTGANGVTERSYNVHRWYRAGWGRYTQADPIGIEGDLNLLSYASGDPLAIVDPFGLLPVVFKPRPNREVQKICKSDSALGCTKPLFRVDCTCHCAEGTWVPSVSVRLKEPIPVYYSTDCYDPSKIRHEELRHVLVYDKSFEEVVQMTRELGQKNFKTQFACESACGVFFNRAFNEIDSHLTQWFIDFTHPWRKCNGNFSFWF